MDLPTTRDTGICSLDHITFCGVGRSRTLGELVLVPERKFQNQLAPPKRFYIDKGYSLLASGAVRRSNIAVTHSEHKIIDRGIHAFVYAQVIFAHVTGWIDSVFVDGTVNAAAKLAGFGGKISRSFQGGNIQLYIFWSVFALIIFIIWALK